MIIQPYTDDPTLTPGAAELLGFLIANPAHPVIGLISLDILSALRMESEELRPLMAELVRAGHVVERIHRNRKGWAIGLTLHLSTGAEVAA